MASDMASVNAAANFVLMVTKYFRIQSKKSSDKSGQNGKYPIRLVRVTMLRAVAARTKRDFDDGWSAADIPSLVVGLDGGACRHRDRRIARTHPHREHAVGAGNSHAADRGAPRSLDVLHRR
jgi:hypothetical protein